MDDAYDFPLILRTQPFSDLNEEEARRLFAACATVREVRAEQQIFPADSHGTELYLLRRGWVRVEISPSGSSGGSRQFTLQGPCVFGELSFLDGSPRSASATAENTLRLYLLHRDQFLRFLADDPALGLRLMLSLSALVAQKVRQTNRVLLEEMARQRELLQVGGHAVATRYREVVENFAFHMQI